MPNWLLSLPPEPPSPDLMLPQEEGTEEEGMAAGLLTAGPQVSWNLLYEAASFFFFFFFLILGIFLGFNY